MIEPDRRTLLKGAGALALSAALPTAALAREPSVLLFGVASDCLVAEYMARTFWRYHCVEPVIATCHEDMLKLIACKRYVLVVSDPHFIDGSVLAWKQRLRQLDPDLPVLFQTGHDLAGFPPAAFEGPATDLLLQPFSLKQLKLAARLHLARWDRPGPVPLPVPWLDPANEHWPPRYAAPGQGLADTEKSGRPNFRT